MSDALASIDKTVTVVEWWQQVPKGAPFTFKAEVAVSDEFLDSDTKALIVRLINKTKNLRSHLIAIAYAIDVHGRMVIGGASSQYATLSMMDGVFFVNPEVSGYMTTGSASTQCATVSMMDRAFFVNPNVSGRVVHAIGVVRYKTLEVSDA
ncbi:hypothetical protein JCM19239_1356 [Vibrio variabilis]|uniref:Uncharacterized protein n=1 Tax=Vibrio variabilis TaxID=990271 RepID=A0ABQ0JR67_9VIBR|nr:hypothetical protein JCM19239_1356 [Vibrio variabilis]